MRLKITNRVSSIKDTMCEVYNFMNEADYLMFSDDDVNEIAQEVDADIRPTFLDEKIYDAIQWRKDIRLESL